MVGDSGAVGLFNPDIFDFPAIVSHYILVSEVGAYFDPKRLVISGEKALLK